MKNYWDNMYLQNKGKCVYPTEDFIRFFKRTFRGIDKQAFKALELGCGMGGGNLYFLKNEGLKPYGVDISDIAIKSFGDDFEDRLSVCDICDLGSFSDFDLIYGLGVLECNKKSDLPKIIDEIYKALKIGGRGFFRVGSNFYHGDKITPGCINKDEAKELFKAFGDLSIDAITRTYENGSKTSKYLEITFIKG